MSKFMTNSKNKFFSALFLTALLIGTVLASNFSNIKNHLYASILPSTLLNLSNQNRLNSKLAQLKINSKLQSAAQLQAENLAAQGSPDHQDTWTWLDQVGYSYNTAAENVAVNLSQSDENNLAMVNSADHQKNLLNKNYSETGIGISTGTYNGQPATYIVQYFGQPSPVRENILTPNLQVYKAR